MSPVCPIFSHPLLLLCLLICLLRRKDVQNYKVPNDAAAGQCRNGHGSFLQGNHTQIHSSVMLKEHDVQQAAIDVDAL